MIKLAHKSVLLNEIIGQLDIKPAKKYIDATLGGGGVARQIVIRGGVLLGIDCDPVAIKETKLKLDSISKKQVGLESGHAVFEWKLVRTNYSQLETVAKAAGFDKVQGIVFDLGPSSYQLDQASRGFSFAADSLLDMRMDPDLKVTAADLINSLSRRELSELFYQFSQEEYSGAVADAICRRRKVKPIKTTGELSCLVRGVVRIRARINPATKIFMALRIAVNHELENLEKALPQAYRLLDRQGKLVVLSFHEGEDRIVKNFLRIMARAMKLKILEKLIVPTREEVLDNPRSRSAKMRVAVKIN